MARKKSEDEYPELREDEERLAREIGKLVVEQIRSSSWSPEDLAKKLGYSDAKQFTKWKSGRNKITAAKLALVAELMKRSVRRFFPESQEPTTLGDKMEDHLRRGEVRELLELIAENLPEKSSQE